MTDSSQLSNRALERLRQLASGNGLAPAAIQLIEASEKTYTLSGITRLEPKTEVATARYTGGARARGTQLLPNAGALQAEVNRRRQAFGESGGWIALATKLLKEQPGEGWGLDERLIALSNFSGIFAASEPCPTCQGNKLLTCPQCHGQGSVTCTQCQGRRQETCYNCGGRGVNPVQPDQPCVICHGKRYVPCRFCRATGFLPCPTCQGRRGISCTACKGTGQITEETTLTCSALTHFSVKGEDLPLGLRRGLDRIGLDKLANGHADIASIAAPAEDAPPVDPYGFGGGVPQERPAVPEVRYQATLPYADLRLSFGGKRAEVAVFGKKGLLMGVPAFLDLALEPRRKELQQAAQGLLGLDEALAARAVRETLGLQLHNKGKLEELRRIYPLGLSVAVMTELLTHMRLALNSFTRRTRATVAIGCGLLSAAVLGGIFMTPVYSLLTVNWPPRAGLAFGCGLPFLLAGGSWAALTSSIRWSLQKRFPKQAVPLRQAIGKTGIAMLAAIGVLFVAALALAPVKPWWVLALERQVYSLRNLAPAAAATPGASAQMTSPTLPAGRPVLAQPPSEPPLHQQPTKGSANIRL